MISRQSIGWSWGCGQQGRPGQLEYPAVAGAGIEGSPGVSRNRRHSPDGSPPHRNTLSGTRIGPRDPLVPRQYWNPVMVGGHRRLGVPAQEAHPAGLPRVCIRRPPDRPDRRPASGSSTAPDPPRPATASRRPGAGGLTVDQGVQMQVRRARCARSVRRRAGFSRAAIRAFRRFCAARKFRLRKKAPEGRAGHCAILRRHFGET